VLTDFYCEFKERKQVAAIYDSYPIPEHTRCVHNWVAELVGHSTDAVANEATNALDAGSPAKNAEERPRQLRSRRGKGT
jgi:hypothetical protein